VLDGWEAEKRIPMNEKNRKVMSNLYHHRQHLRPNLFQMVLEQRERIDLINLFLEDS
jgi:hypothetical protein